MFDQFDHGKSAERYRKRHYEGNYSKENRKRDPMNEQPVKFVSASNDIRTW